MNEELKILKIGIPYPPDYIFKFRKNRIQPAMKQLEEPNVSYIPTTATYKNGIFIGYKGVPYPSKGHVFPEAMYAVNQLKRILMSSLGIITNRDAVFILIGILLSNKKALLERFIDAVISIVDLNILKPYYLEDEYYSVATKEIRTFVRETLCHIGIPKEKADLFGEIVSLPFQYDNAYYYRFIDIMTETDQYRIENYTLLEFERLLSILMERDFNIHQQAKYRNVQKLFKAIWFVPSIRKAIKYGLSQTNIANCGMDDADRYHLYLVGGYNYMGKTIEERIKEYIEFHGGEDKLPPRIQYMPISDDLINTIKNDIELSHDIFGKREIKEYKDDMDLVVASGLCKSRNEARKLSN